MFDVVDDTQFGRGLVAKERIPAGRPVLDLAQCAKLSSATKYSVQAGPHTHIDGPVLSRLNHSCQPNVYVNIDEDRVESIADIEPGAMLAFFYPSTEWAMSHPFMCGCGDSQCIGLVVGAAFTPAPALAKHRLNTHIRELLADPGARLGFEVSVKQFAVS